MSTYLKNMAGYKHKVVKGSETRTEESSKREGDELEYDMSKKQKIDEHVEVEKDDQEEVEMKRHIEIVKDDKVAIDAIPLATKPPVIVEYQIDKDGKIGYFKLIRADGRSKRPEDDYERVLWGDLKVIFEPDIKSDKYGEIYKGTKYPLTPITISNMLNKKLQADRWNEMCYQLLKLMTKQEKVTTAGRINAVRDEIKDISEKR
ncbi:hypothetical protein Tco_0313328 [Tanacetum coccineum]